VLRAARTPVPVDEVDLALCRVLARDARISHRRLAREVGMSPPAVAERVARLERAQVIRGYTIDIDWAALGYPVTVYLAVTALPGYDLSAVIDELSRVPEIESMSVITGPLDLLVRLRTRGHEHLRELLGRRIWQIPGVQRTETFLGLGDIEPQSYVATMLQALGEDESERGAEARSR
jgi:Lrp/AsnC family transcriptional regulator, leucine-responsive regulatory protein